MATKLALIALALSGMIVLSMQFPYDPMSREERKYQERRNQILTVNTFSNLLKKRIHRKLLP